MKLSTLKFWRFLFPAIFVLFAGVIIGKYTGLWNYSLPSNFSEFKNFVPAFLIAVIYYALGLGNYANRCWHIKVTNNLREKLVSAANLSDDSEVYTWKSLKGVFYSFVDSDSSLKSQSQLLYFNGLIWTAAADAGLVSFGSIVLSSTFFVRGVEGAGLCLLVFATTLVVSVLISFAVTLKHISLGNTQMETLEMNYQAELKEKLLKIASKSRN